MCSTNHARMPHKNRHMILAVHFSTHSQRTSSESSCCARSNRLGPNVRADGPHYVGLVRTVARSRLRLINTIDIFIASRSYTYHVYKTDTEWYEKTEKNISKKTTIINWKLPANFARNEIMFDLPRKCGLAKCKFAVSTSPVCVCVYVFSKHAWVLTATKASAHVHTYEMEINIRWI